MSHPRTMVQLGPNPHALTQSHPTSSYPDRFKAKILIPQARQSPNSRTQLSYPTAVTAPILVPCSRLKKQQASRCPHPRHLIKLRPDYPHPIIPHIIVFQSRQGPKSRTRLQPWSKCSYPNATQSHKVLHDTAEPEMVEMTSLKLVFVRVSGANGNKASVPSLYRGLVGSKS